MGHPVKCKVCNQTFDRDKEEAVKVDARRYAHKKCSEGYELPKEEQDLAKLHEYLKMLFKDNYNYLVLNKQIESLINDPTEKRTYSGILKSLIYWYEVKSEPIEKSNYRIGIVPHIYKQAFEYYYDLFLKNQRNESKNIEEYRNPKVQVVRIKQPVSGVPPFRLFDLDGEE